MDIGSVRVLGFTMRHTANSVALSAEAAALGLAPRSGLATLITDIHSTADRRWSRRIAVDVVCVADALMIILAGLIPALIYAKIYLANGAYLLKEPATPWLAILQTGLIAAIISVGILASLGPLRDALNATFGDVTTALQ